MVHHGSPEIVGVIELVGAEIVTVLLHAGKEPGKGLHESIVVHDGVPLISLQPCCGRAVMLRQYYGIRIGFLNGLAEILPEFVIVFG